MCRYIKHINKLKTKEQSSGEVCLKRGKERREELYIYKNTVAKAHNVST
jgi:hypothetical protein